MSREEKSFLMCCSILDDWLLMELFLKFDVLFMIDEVKRL